MSAFCRYVFYASPKTLSFGYKSSLIHMATF